MKVIGIDPGVTTGIAIKEKNELIAVDSMHHNQAFGYIEYEIALSPRGHIFIVVEDARKRGNGGPKAQAKAQGAGAIKMLCSLWESYLQIFDDNEKIHCIFQKPLRGCTKKNAEEFKLTTKWTEKTNEHSRDAGMIAWHYTPTR